MQVSARVGVANVSGVAVLNRRGEEAVGRRGPFKQGLSGSDRR